MNETYRTLLKDILANIVPLRRRGADVEWRKAWGKSGIAEKRLIAKTDGLPFSITLKRFPKSEQLTNKGGYELHSHPSLEIGYVVKGAVRIYFEDIGEKEYNAGDLIVQPAGLKHAAMSAAEETEILAITVPAAGSEDKDDLSRFAPR